MRTHDEIARRLKSGDADDFLGTQHSDLLEFLPLSHARPFLRDDAPADALAKWDDALPVLDRETVLGKMRGYWDFALDKCTSHRGISAGRSIDHYRAWCWLLGDDEALAVLEDSGRYAPYGAPMLDYLRARFELGQPDAVLTTMVERGECSIGCDEGCNG